MDWVNDCVFSSIDKRTDSLRVKVASNSVSSSIASQDANTVHNKIVSVVIFKDFIVV